MTHQSNKQFNTYKAGLNLDFLQEYCMEYIRGAWMFQVYGAQQRGGKGLLHGLCLRGRVCGRLPELSFWEDF